MFLIIFICRLVLVLKDINLMNSVYSQISDILIQHQGVDIRKYDDVFLRKTILNRIRETKCISGEDYLKYFQEISGESANLLKSLQINYSEFFRNSLTFAAIEHIVFPNLIGKLKIAKSHEIRIWSAACAGGQEPYSIAIIAEELRQIYKNAFKYRIFATDQNEDQINFAKEGIYKEFSINNLIIRRLMDWFRIDENLFIVKDELKENIDFSVFDLFDIELNHPIESIFGDFDIVFCANLLFYFNQKNQRIILKKVGDSLAKGGFLISGESERDILLKNGFIEIIPKSAIFQKKL